MTAPESVPSRVLGANIVELSLHVHGACMVLWAHPHPLCAVKESDGHVTYFSDLLFLKSWPTFIPELMSMSTDSSLSLVHSGPPGPQSTLWDN